MQDKHRQNPDEEPAVTFELEEAPQPSRRGRLGAVGTTAVTGVGLVSGGATPDIPDSLDVFDQPAGGDAVGGDVAGAGAAGEIDAPGVPGTIPTTSFDEIMDAAPDPAFPAIDFSVPVFTTAEADGVETLHGAQGAVGGGFRLDDPSGQEAFGAPPPLAEPVDDGLFDGLDDDSDALLEEAEADDLG